VRIAPTVLVLAFVATAAFGAEVYRSKDADGNVSFSDRPQNANAVAITVLTPRSARPAAPPPQPKPAPKAGDSAAGTSSAAAKPQAPAQTPEEREAEKAKNCEIARQRQQSYAISHRLYRAGPNGERQYLNDQEIDEARARAAADVETWCN